MILRSVELESFGRFKNQTVEFRRGMNLVIGPNEAGKSTLAEAVPAVLFGTAHLEKYKTWGRNACSASLFFEGNGRTIQVRRNLMTDEVELVEKDDMYHILSQFSGKAPLRGRSVSCREYRELVAALLGVGDDQLFRATYFFGHHPQEWSGDALAQNLRTLVSGTAEADYAAILDDLLEEHFSLTAENPWGRDKKQAREYEKICCQLEDAGEAGKVPVFVELDDDEDVQAQIDALSTELVKDRLEYEKGLRYVEHVRARSARANDEQKEVLPEASGREDKKPIVASEGIAKQLFAVGLPENPPVELPDLLAEATEIRQEMAELQQPYSVLNNKEKKAPTVPWIWLATVVSLSVTATLAAWWFSFFLQWVAVGAGATSVLALLWGGWRHAARKKTLADCKQQRARLDQRKYAAQTKQAELSERCEAYGLPSSPIDLVRLQKLVATHRELLESYWQGSHQKRDDIVSNVNESEASEEDAPKVDHFVELAEEDNELQQMEARLVDFSRGLEEKEARLRKLKDQLESIDESRESHSSFEGSALYRRKLDVEERIGVLRAAVDLLAGSVEEFGQSHLVKLNDEAGRVFSKITSGRYKDIRLDENMLPFVKVDNRRWLPVDSFSRGTVDAIYLALRIALAKVRDDGRSLPLMLDDPFVHLDHKRLTKALNAVDLAAADGQLILFSHNMELGKRAAKERWHVVPLDGDNVNATTEEEEGDEHVGQLHLL